MSCQHLSLEGGKCNDCGYCMHEVIYFGLCAVCGQSVDQSEETNSKDHIDMNHKTTGIKVSLKEAERLEKEDEKRLLKEKKLSLIIDLDQTILHAAWEPHIAKWVDENKNDERAKEMSTFSLDGSINKYTIKLRPGLIEFLKDMSHYYEMHIYTMGTRAYADAVAKVIDPTGQLFQDRILSRDENGNMTKKRLERLFPSDQTKVVVLDDRADVWDYSPNLIQIKPYEYFAGIGDINAPPNSPKVPLPVTKSTTETDEISTNDNAENTSEKEEKKEVEKPIVQHNEPTYTPKLHDPDQILSVIKNVLNQVHEQYYKEIEKDSNSKPNVATILSSLKSQILKECYIVFSGVIPLQYRPEDSSIWKMASSFGAQCMAELTGKATHLVAANAGTSKVNTARKYESIRIISPAWLTNSVWEWKRQEEEDYLIPLPREGSTSEVENPEEASLDFFDDKIDIEWDDEEVDEALGSDDSDDESISSESKKSTDEDKTQEENNIISSQTETKLKEESQENENISSQIRKNIEDEDGDEDVDDWLGKELNDIEAETDISESDYGSNLEPNLGNNRGGFVIYGGDGNLIQGDSDSDLISDDEENNLLFDEDKDYEGQDEDDAEIRTLNREIEQNYHKRKRGSDSEEDEIDEDEESYAQFNKKK